MFKSLLGAALVASLAIVISGCSSAPITTFGGDIPAGLSDNDVKTAISKSLIDRKWSARADGMTIYASHTARSHTAKIKIPYSNARYEILYVDSVNLNGDLEKGTVHKRYNTWARNLQSDINGFLNNLIVSKGSIDSVVPFQHELKPATSQEAESTQAEADQAETAQ